MSGFHTGYFVGGEEELLSSVLQRDKQLPGQIFSEYDFGSIGAA